MTTGLAETMEAVFADLVGTPPPDSKGEATVIWYLKALQRLDKQANDSSITHKALLAEVGLWLEIHLLALKKKRDWIDDTCLPTVEAVTRDKIQHSGKKSFDYFYGVCGFRAQDKYEWPTDPVMELSTIAWCRNNDIPLIVKTTLDKAAIKRFIKKTGEIPPGVKVAPQVETFYVKPAPLAELPGEQPELLGKD